MLTEASNYDDLYRDFRWDIPVRFNIATACCDRHADGTNRLALIYVDEDGGATRHSFDDISGFSRRFANVLKADGLARGDRVAVFLSQSLELPIAHIAAFRAGLVSIPLFALFGEDALEFRLSNSGSRKSAIGCHICKTSTSPAMPSTPALNRFGHRSKPRRTNLSPSILQPTIRP